MTLDEMCDAIAAEAKGSLMHLAVLGEIDRIRKERPQHRPLGLTWHSRRRSRLMALMDTRPRQPVTSTRRRIRSKSYEGGR